MDELKLIAVILNNIPKHSCEIKQNTTRLIIIFSYKTLIGAYHPTEHNSFSPSDFHLFLRFELTHP